MRSKIFPFVVVILVALATLFLSPNCFVEKEVLLKKYVFVGGGLLLGCITFLKNRQFVHLDKLTICTIAFISYLLIVTCLNSPSILEGLSLIAFLFMFFFFKECDLPQQHINMIIVLLCLSQAVYGILQYFHVANSFSDFPIVGTYDNPAGFAACLAIAFPLNFVLCNSDNYIYRTISLCAIIIMIVSIILSESRTGVISVGIVTLYYAYTHIPVQFERWKKRLIPIIFLVGIALFVMLIMLKRDSASGRLLIWQVTWSMIKDSPLLGEGTGAFLADYMTYQAHFFTTNPTSKYVLLADNNFHPFNEYLLLMVEYGAVAFVLLAILVFIVFRSVKVSLYMYCLLALGIFSLFSYPFEYPFIWFVVAYCLGQLSKVEKPYISITLLSKRWFKTLLLSIVILGVIFLIKDVKFEYQWAKVTKESLLNKTKDTMPIYERLYNSWNGDHLFLYNYGAELNKNQDYEKSIELLNQCKQYWNDYHVQMLLADNYFNLKKWNSAECHFRLASNMCPNRFFPLYKLHETYLFMDQKDKATQLARILIEKEIKINSPIIFSIKARMKKYLISNQVY